VNKFSYLLLCAAQTSGGATHFGQVNWQQQQQQAHCLKPGQSENKYCQQAQGRVPARGAEVEQLH
jgi:hypothetical protein